MSVLTVSWEDPGPLLGTQMGFVSHAEHQTWIFRPRQQAKHYKNPCFHSPWRPNGQFGPPVMQSLAQAATLGHKSRLNATWQHRNQTEITRLRHHWTSFSRVTGSGCCYGANKMSTDVTAKSQMIALKHKSKGSQEWHVTLTLIFFIKMWLLFPNKRFKSKLFLPEHYSFLPAEVI